MRRACAACAALLIAAHAARAQGLVSKQIGTDAGLANNTVGSGFQDSKGYVWFATAEGLTRHDGRTFATYGTADGLPHAVVHDIVEDRWGHLWVATLGGLARLVEDPSPGERRFQAVSLGVPSQPERLIFAAGSLWCFTEHGLLRGSPDERGGISFSVAIAPRQLSEASDDLIEDREHRVWAVLKDALASVGPAPERRLPLPVDATTKVALASDETGHLFFGHEDALFELDDVARPAWRRLPIRLPPGSGIQSIALDRRGIVWLGTAKGLFGWRREGYADQPLLGPASFVATVFVDRQENVWAATIGDGVFMIGRDLVVRYRAREAIGQEPVNQLVEAGPGHLVGVGFTGSLFEIEGNAVRALGPSAPELRTVYRRIVRDGRGRWWALSDDGLFYSDAPRPGGDGWRRAGTIRPERVDNPTGPALFAHPGGALWIGGVRNALYTVAPASTPAPQPVPFDPVLDGLPARMAVDRSGGLWVADRSHLWRLRGRTLQTFTAQPGLPETLVRSMYVDARGWLWVGLRYGGLSVSRNPEADRPSFSNYSSASGLRSDTVHAITADAYGRMYLVTGRGLDRLDPSDGRVRPYDDLGGASASTINALLTGLDGRIWLATHGGVVRLDPDSDRVPPPAPPVHFTRVDAGGDPVAIPARSADAVSGLRIPASRNSVRLEFAGLSFSPGLERYQYRLEGADPGWNAPTTNRVVAYPRLPAGRYRFVVRSLNDRDEPSAPATVSFEILQPFWRTWWFLSIAAAAIAGSGTLAYRQRLARRQALEKVRRQVAHDLHDEMGSGLAQIAVLSEVARRDTAGAPEALTDIAAVARDMRGSITDIIWAIDPRRDTLDDLVSRMRQVAANLLDPDRVSLEIATPPKDEMKAIEVPPDRRRHCLLLFKEAMTNVARHSQATNVTVDVRLDRRDLVLRIGDNGRGFDVTRTFDGTGQRAMRQRAADLGGTLRVESGAQGTSLHVRFTVGR